MLELDGDGLILGRLAMQRWEDADAQSREKFVRSVIRARARRGDYFPKSLFADPAWDMLLELYSARLGQRRISVTGTIEASQVPATTGLRWLNVLFKHELAWRYDDPFDGRRVYVQLADHAHLALDNYFQSLRFGIPAK